MEGHESARDRGKAIDGAAVTDENMLSLALHLRGQNLSLRDIAARLVITSGTKRAVPPRPRPSCVCCATTTSRPRSDRPGPVKARGTAERGSYPRRIA
jgi:hypothetical protein